MTDFGYMGSILKIDLTTGNVSNVSTADYAEKYIGGRGIAVKIYWDEIKSGTKAFDPENPLIFVTGPVTGFKRFAASRVEICGKSPEMDPETFSYASLGGSWGSWLKYIGYDGMILTGKSDRPVYLYLDSEGRIELRDSAYLWGTTTIDAREKLESELGKDAKIVAIGPAAENMVHFATASATQNSGFGCGLASVMGSKKLKAIAIVANEKIKPIAADPDGLKNIAQSVLELTKRNWENMRQNLYGKKSACYGCVNGCSRRAYEADGRKYRSFCQGTLVYMRQAMKYEQDGPETARLATRLCDLYGLDTMVMEPLIIWLDLCYQAGIINERDTGLPLSKIGSVTFIESLVKMISYREGFGDVLARGTIYAAKVIGKESDRFFSQARVAHKTSEVGEYDPRMILTNALIYATEPQKAIHLVHGMAHTLRRWNNCYNGWEDSVLSTDVYQRIAREYWGGEAAVDFSSFEGKALAAKMIQDYGYIKECLILCDMTWPIHQVREVDPTVRLCTLESRILTAITGREFDENDLLKLGERIYNFQRVLMIRDGWNGRHSDTLMDYHHEEPLRSVYWSPECLAPGKNGEVISRKGIKLDRGDFEKMKDEFYELRGWDIESGIPTKAKLSELGLAGVTEYGK